MSFSTSRSLRTGSVATGTFGAALVAAMLASPAAGAPEPGRVAPVASCTPHSSGLAKGVGVKVAVKRLDAFKGTVRVRVRLAVTGTGTATGYGYADACPGGVSNPQEIEQTVTWTGTRTVRTDYTASGRTTKLATRAAVREARKLCRTAAVQDISEATVRKTEATARDLAVTASSTTPPPPA
jgi:hypothetical protein